MCYLVYYVQSVSIIGEDIVVRKDIEKYRALYAEPKKEFEILCWMRRTCNKGLVKYDTEGAIIIEKYCDKCAKVIEDSSPKHAN